MFKATDENLRGIDPAEWRMFSTKRHPQSPESFVFSIYHSLELNNDFQATLIRWNPCLFIRKATVGNGTARDSYAISL